MTTEERQLIWADVVEAWLGVSPRKRWSVAYRIALILKMPHPRGQKIINVGLDRPQQQEAFWARVSNMNYMNEKGKHGSH